MTRPVTIGVNAIDQRYLLACVVQIVLQVIVRVDMCGCEQDKLLKTPLFMFSLYFPI